MAQVTITINSREYAIACENGQEARIMQLAAMLEEKAQMLRHISGQINENMLLAMIGILLADDLAEARKASADAAPIAVDNSAEVLREADKLIQKRLQLVSEKIKSVAKRIETI